MLDWLTTVLPTGPGLLPKWQLIAAAMAIFNAAQNFTTLKLTQRIYNAPGVVVTPVQARTFAIWTLTSAVIRSYAAYNLHDKTLYDMALLSYALAFFHFMSELFYFRSARVNPGVLSPIIVSSTTLIWMWNQYDYYVRA